MRRKRINWRRGRKASTWTWALNRNSKAFISFNFSSFVHSHTLNHNKSRQKMLCDEQEKLRATNSEYLPRCEIFPDWKVLVDTRTRDSEHLLMSSTLNVTQPNTLRLRRSTVWRWMLYAIPITNCNLNFHFLFILCHRFRFGCLICVSHLVEPLAYRRRATNHSQLGEHVVEHTSTSFIRSLSPSSVGRSTRYSNACAFLHE